MSAYDNDPRVTWDARSEGFRVQGVIVKRRDRFSWGIHQLGMPNPYVAGFSSADEAIRTLIGDPQ